MAAARSRQKRGKEARPSRWVEWVLITGIRGMTWITPNLRNSSTKNRIYSGYFEMYPT
jgi:hypothetical protein